MLTHRGDASLEVERALAIDPGCAAAHGLRMALIVRADDEVARAALEGARPRSRARARAIPRAVTPPPRAPGATGITSLALERYGAIVVDDPRDIVALASRMRSTFGSAGGGCCATALRGFCPSGTPT